MPQTYVVMFGTRGTIIAATTTVNFTNEQYGPYSPLSTFQSSIVGTHVAFVRPPVCLSVCLCVLLSGVEAAHILCAHNFADIFTSIFLYKNFWVFCSKFH